MRTRKPYFSGSSPIACPYWFLSQSFRCIGVGVWSYVSGFLAELHSSIWRLWPCILTILRHEITSLIGNLLHNFNFLCFYPCPVPLSSTMDFGSAGAISPSTVAILAQGTNWAVADMQALFCRFDSHRSPLLVSPPIPQVHRGRCVVLCFWVSCRASFFHLAPVALYPGHTSGQNNQSHWQPAAQL